KEEFEKEFKGDAERVKRRLARERFIMPDGCDYYTLYAKRNEPNIGEIINVALEAIEDANKAKLEGVFRNIDFNSEANLGHNKDSARIEWGDTLMNPKLVEGDSLMKFDVVVANPPFSLDKWGAESAEADRFHRFHRGVPPKSKGDYAFISHMIESAKENGGK